MVVVDEWLSIQKCEVGVNGNKIMNQIISEQITKEGFKQNKIINSKFPLTIFMTSTPEGNVARKKIQNYSYQLNSSIGKGYSSIVYKGKNDETNQTVAIKVIDIKMIKGEVHKNLLASEIEVLRNLKNTQNIIHVYDIYTTKNNTYIVTELCDQGDLAKLISNRKTIPEPEASDFMSQIINGYNQIFNRGVVHRDLKPANIFLKAQEIKIADFGFAMKQTESKKYSSYNVGSPIYMPPQALNDNKYSFKSDIWALGVIYFEMLTGKTPWRAKTQKQLGRQLMSIPIDQLIPKGLSQGSVQFLKRTLTVNLNNRMSPEQLRRFSFFSEKTDKQSTKGDIVSENSIQDTRHCTIKSAETSLNRNTINTPKNFQRATFLKNTLKDIKQLKQIKNTSLPKPYPSIKTEYQISPKGNQNFNPGMTFAGSQKQLPFFKSANIVTIIDKKLISKQLLSQIHFCRFLYKLLMRIDNKLSSQINCRFQEMKSFMAGLVFERLNQIANLGMLNVFEKKEYQESSDCGKINQIVNQYQGKYEKDLASTNWKMASIVKLRQEINGQIMFLYSLIQGHGADSVKEEVIVVDYLITLRQLLFILEEDNLGSFHNKAKMEQIVEGCPSSNISLEHISAITSKLKTLRML